MMNQLLLLFLSIIPALSFAQDTVSTQRPTKHSFLENIRQLVDGQMENLPLKLKADSISIQYFIGDKIDDRDKDQHPSGKLAIRDFEAIDATSVCSITDQYVLVVSNYKNQLRALSIDVDGNPISSFLLVDQFIYVSRDFYEIESRRFSPNQPFFFDTDKQQFIFSSIFKIKEPRIHDHWIDLHHHDDEMNHRMFLQVNEKGEFVACKKEVYLSNRIETDQMTLYSSFFQAHNDKLLQPPTIKKDKDTTTIFLDLDQSHAYLHAKNKSDHLVRVIPKSIEGVELTGQMKVSQQFETNFVLNSDGDYCIIEDKRYTSNWRESTMQDDIFCVEQYTRTTIHSLVTNSLTTFKQMVREACPTYRYMNDLQAYDHLDQMNKHISLSRIRLKIQFISADEKYSFTHFFVFKLQDGC